MTMYVHTTRVLHFFCNTPTYKLGNMVLTGPERDNNCHNKQRGSVF